MITFSQLIDTLKLIDFTSLPGTEAQIRMAPTNRLDDIRKMGEGRMPVKSSVLLLLYPLNERDAGVVFIRRPKYNGVHSGQISFPGGHYEPGDYDLRHTALRESQEEIGVDPKKIEVIGKLTDLYIPPSNHRVSPYVGVMHQKPVFKPDPIEVESILEVALADFSKAEHLQCKPILLTDGRHLETPCYYINENIIWGATAMMMAEFLECTKKGS
jgi:8-oxo-dGTP pyrophosphatase MutT (NUDIX family)